MPFRRCEKSLTLQCALRRYSARHLHMPAQKKKAPPLSIRIDADVRRELEKLAAEDDRSLSAYVNRLLRQHVESAKKGKKPPA